jgi:hypothetical protein
MPIFLNQKKFYNIWFGLLSDFDYLQTAAPKMYIDGDTFM